ncbi:hypothetical protein [Actinokineospora enzanensis]|uniref:hypothetical protein n=1 Tax=Actinokineospora enzanensis TaxID=155975 RepID=UPI00037C0BC2|nr:hypothetical protein [Actinokineospora enzanensis]
MLSGDSPAGAVLVHLDDMPYQQRAVVETVTAVAVGVADPLDVRAAYLLDIPGEQATDV